MLNAYYKEYRTFVNNELAGTEGSVILCEESEAEEKTIEINWDNVDVIYSKYGILIRFSLYCASKGKVISYQDGEHFLDRKIKEWKTPKLNAQLVIHCRKVNISMRELMNYYDADKAIQYMKERGLDIKEGK